jgi:transposase-like protein
MVNRLKAVFARWNERPLTDADYPFLFLDGFHLKVRVVRRVVAVPVLAVLGVDDVGRKVLVALRLAASESATLWSGVLLDLQRRGLRAPRLLIVDGHGGLRKALAAWPEAKVQRCTQHKLRNLLEHCPIHARPEVQRDFHRILQAKDGLAARAAYDAFLRKWSALCAPVAASLEEAGLDLLTYYDFPKSMWKSLRTTNAIENLNREFRRRTKTQASFSSEEAALTLLYGLIAFGQIHLRKIDGHRELPALLKTQKAHAA